MKPLLPLLLALASLAPLAALAAPDLPTGVLEAEMAEDWQAAAAGLEQALEGQPQRRDWWQRLSQVRAAAGEPDAAADALVQAAAVGPPDAELFLAASAALAQADRPAEALEQLRQARALAPDQRELIRREAALHGWLGDTRSSAELLGQLWEAGDRAPATGRDYARTLSALGRSDAARAVLRVHLELHPQDQEALWLMSRLESWRGDYAQALEWLDRYRAAGGDAGIHLTEKAAVLAWADRPHAAMELLRQLPEDGRHQTRKTYAEAVAYRRLNRHAAMQGRLTELRGARSDGVADADGLTRYLTTSLRDSTGLDSRYSSDSDGIDIWISSLQGQWWARPGLRLNGQLERHRYDVSRDGGLAAADGRALAVTAIDADLHWHIGGHWQLGAALGQWQVDNAADDDMATGGLSLAYRPHDALRLRLAADRQAHAVSPRAVDRGIGREEWSAELRWQPDLRWELSARFAEADFFAAGSCAACQDDNRRRQLQASTQRRLLYRDGWQLSAGLRASITRFDDNLDNGYYDPRRFEHYALVSNLQVGLGQNHALAVSASAGGQRDQDLDGRFSPAVDLATLLTLGIWADTVVELRAASSYGVNRRTDDYDATSVGLNLTHRF